MKPIIRREEYPRPDFVRDVWQNLNGEWQFAFDPSDAGYREGWQKPGRTLPLTINVPFCYQSRMSGIGDETLKDIVWYRRTFTAGEAFAGKRVLLRFGAVDYRTQVYVNGSYVGEHAGGYSPFYFDVTDFLNGGENDLCLRVEDRPDREQPRGKQYWREGWMRCWYVPITGVWQTVYLEAATETRIESLHVTPDIDTGSAKICVRLNHAPGRAMTARLTIAYEDKPETAYRSLTVALTGKNTYVSVDMVDTECVEGIQLWSPTTPVLYSLTAELFEDGQAGDCVSTYFGMRKAEVKDGYFLLNNRACYLRMVLDQGYWPDSLLTPPTAEALKEDVEWTLKLGYNCARKHQKIEDPRYYYWADRLGLMVWGELPSAFEFSSAMVMNLANTMADFIQRDYNHPSIIAWAPFNESWGVTRIYDDLRMQSAVRMLYHQCKALDPTRVVSSNDGWEQVETDILGLHDYTPDGESLAMHFADRDRLDKYAASRRVSSVKGFTPTRKEAFMLTEYGGISISDGQEGTWGYHGKPKDENEFFERFASVTNAIRAIPYCRGYCYTQLTDVRQEANGILNGYRKPKVDPERFRAINVSPQAEWQGI